MKHKHKSSSDVADDMAHYWIMGGNGLIIGEGVCYGLDKLQSVNVINQDIT